MKRLLAAAATTAILATGGVAVAGAAQNSSSNSGDTTSTTAAAGPHRAARAGVVAQLIGIAPAELRKEVKAGKTIAQVAEAHHVDPKTLESELVSKIDSAIDAAASNGKITSDRAGELKGKVPDRVTKLVENTPHTGRLRRAGNRLVAVAAKAIGITPKELRADLKNGQSVADVAKAHNVDPQTVIDALTKVGDQRVERLARRFVERHHR
jgi:hypothetical protein